MHSVHLLCLLACAWVAAPAVAQRTVVVRRLAGLRCFCQSATLSAGFNPLGVLASNGVDFVVGTR